MVMVYVPKGTFIVGSESGEEDEQPVHEVYPDAFWIYQTEITYTIYARFDSSKYGSQPVQKLTWQQAQAYCAIYLIFFGSTPTWNHSTNI